MLYSRASGACPQPISPRSFSPSNGGSMFKNVLVLGGGSAGLFAALSLKTRIPTLDVTVVRSPELGVIGVGESTTPNMPHLLFDYLKIKRRRFYELAQPTWKLGI